jgi:hypothetical protein
VTLKLWQLVAAVLALLALGLLGTAAVSRPSPVTRYVTVTETVQAKPSPRAAAYLRAALPAIDAYGRALHGYAGMTAVLLRSTYDTSLDPSVVVVSATASGYCVQSTVGGATASMRGPAGAIEPGPCRG